MNKDRRKRLDAIRDKLTDIMFDFETLKGEIDEIKGEEEDAFYNMPESLQSSERGETMEQYIGLLEECCDTEDIATVVDNLEQIIDGE